MGQIQPLADRLGAPHRFVELAPRSDPIAGTAERLSGITERFARPHAYSEPDGLFVAVLYQAVAGAGLRAALAPTHGTTNAQPAPVATARTPQRVLATAAETSATRSGLPMRTSKRLSNQSTASCGPGWRSACTRVRLAQACACLLDESEVQ